MTPASADVVALRNEPSRVDRIRANEAEVARGEAAAIRTGKELIEQREECQTGRCAQAWSDWCRENLIEPGIMSDRTIRYRIAQAGGGRPNHSTNVDDRQSLPITQNPRVDIDTGATVPGPDPHVQPKEGPQTHKDLSVHWSQIIDCVGSHWPDVTQSERQELTDMVDRLRQRPPAPMDNNDPASAQSKAASPLPSRVAKKYKEYEKEVLHNLNIVSVWIETDPRMAALFREQQAEAIERFCAFVRGQEAG
ncbi:MAG TPA: hypothetical protein VGM07_21735 [Stellaceae bacterium]|jgi:hypothetical protein